MQKDIIKNILLLEPKEQEITVNAWVRTVRDSKGIAFIELSDGTTIKTIQVVIEETLTDRDAVLKRISTGCSLSVTGNLIPSPAKGQTLELRAS